MRIEHANISVNDVQASTRFYRELFGVDVRWEGITELGFRAVHLGDEKTYLSLFESSVKTRAPADYTATGFNHLGFEVNDLDAFRARLGQMGVEIVREEEYDPGRRLYFYDPDGIEVELVEY